MSEADISSLRPLQGSSCLQKRLYRQLLTRLRTMEWVTKSHEKNSVLISLFILLVWSPRGQVETVRQITLQMCLYGQPFLHTKNPKDYIIQTAHILTQAEETSMNTKSQRDILKIKSSREETPNIKRYPKDIPRIKKRPEGIPTFSKIIKTHWLSRTIPEKLRSTKGVPETPRQTQTIP